MKWRKMPNRLEWKSSTGVRIVWNPWFKIFQIDKGYTYAHAKSLKDAKEIAENWRFR